MTLRSWCDRFLSIGDGRQLKIPQIVPKQMGDGFLS